MTDSLTTRLRDAAAVHSGECDCYFNGPRCITARLEAIADALDTGRGPVAVGESAVIEAIRRAAREDT